VTDLEPDLELLARLREADPASSLRPADPDRVVELLEAAMSQTVHESGSDSATPARESRETGTHDRSPLTWLMAAAAVVLIAVAGVFGLAQRGHDSSSTAAQGTVTRLGYAPPAGRCLTPQTGVLRQQAVAFRGTLVSLASGTATFDVAHWYAGAPTDTARVTAAPPRLAELVHAADLSIGGDYLISADDGNVTACGFSGPATPALRQLYARAFG
jgi:hypothetical protein